MSSFDSLVELENLFVEKLQEKYKLNIRDIKRAFSRFDLDKNGLLDLEEVTKGIQLFLNGVKESQVKELVSCYDLNGDGKISYEEFLSFLSNRNAIQDNYSESQSQSQRGSYNSETSSNYYNNQSIPSERSYYTPSATSSAQQEYNNQKQFKHKTQQRPPSSRQSDAPSHLDVTNPKELEYRAKVFLQNLKSYLTKKATDMRLTGKVKAPLTMSIHELHESVVRGLISKMFQPYTGQGDGRARESTSGVEMNDFAKVLRSINFPGSPPIRNEVIQFLFTLCSVAETGEQFVNEEGRIVANPNVLVDLIFGTPVNSKDRKERGLTKVGKDENLDGTNEEDITGRHIKGFVAKLDAGRQIVGSGPVKLTNATDAKTEKQADILAVPMRFVSRKSRTALLVPSNYDPVKTIQRSNSLPGYDLCRRYVFGMSTSTYSGNRIYVLPSTPPAFQQKLNKANVDGALTARTRNSNFIDNATLVYASAGLGVVHNLNDNSQLFFDNHHDDITVIAVSPDGQYAATGCMGKNAVVHVWSTNIPVHESNKALTTFGGPGLFARGVCAIEFSWDNRYIVIVGCDDGHTMTIFQMSNGKKIQEIPIQNGIPPQIKWINYCSMQQYTEYISREHSGLCDLFVTAGEHHLKFWSFRRPSDNDTGSLQYKSASIGKAQVSAAKCYLCCGFIYCEDKSYDIVAGGSNGIMYIWRKGVLITFSQVLRGKIQCLIVQNDRVICGGAGGVVKVLDCRTLATIQEFSLIHNTPVPTKKPGSGTNRPKSAGHVRPGSSGSNRPPLSAPKTHAAGSDPRRKQSSDDMLGGNILAGPSTERLKEIAADNEESGVNVVTGIAAVKGVGRGSAQAMYLIATLGTGKAVRIDVGNSLEPVQGRGGYYGKDLFHFHTGAVYGLAADVTTSKRIVATVCDDRKLCVWDAQDCVLLAKALVKNPSRCCHIDKSNSFIAVGCTLGSITVHYLTDSLTSKGYYRINEVAYRKDAGAEATDIKFSPSNEMIALGSRDDNIYIYRCELNAQSTGQGRHTNSTGSCILRALHRLRGHSATITHLDWSIDSQLLQSTCGAYELLCWDISTGKLNTSINPADVKWKTRHCILGFSVMGIWPPYSDGTDINSIDVSNDKGLVVTANDAGGLVRLFNHPCVVKNAPAKEYTGHSSHVTNVRFMVGAEKVISTGGNDSSVVLWDVVPDESLKNTDVFR